MIFIRSAIKSETKTDLAYYVCLDEEAVFLKDEAQRMTLPLLKEKEAALLKESEPYFIGWLDHRPCYVVTCLEPRIPEGCCRFLLKDVYLNGDPLLSDIIGYAKPIVDLNRNVRFCGRCATPTVNVIGEHARQCPECQLIHYPRVSPAVIAAVCKGDQILLARGRRFSDKDMFSVLAGFVEPGESLEDAVKREIREEVGIEVGDIRYFKSQPWPFPDSLMIGFTAEYVSGDIKVDEVEIVEAAWFSADAMPKVPSRKSISSELIQHFLRTHSR